MTQDWLDVPCPDGSFASARKLEPHPWVVSLTYPEHSNPTQVTPCEPRGNANSALPFVCWVASATRKQDGEDLYVRCLCCCSRLTLDVLQSAEWTTDTTPLTVYHQH